MRIALRPSGGRGDYELAGTYNDVHAGDLLGKRFLFEITPSLTIDGRARAKRLAGKPRIRPEDGGKHAYVVISGILLLPPARRELDKTSESAPELQARTFTVSGIDVDVLNYKSDLVTFAPKSVWARTLGGFLKIDYVERMAMITAIWSLAKSDRSLVATLIRNHEASVASGNHDQIARSAAEIQTYYKTGADVLPTLLAHFDLPNAASPTYTGVSDTVLSPSSEDDDSLPEISQRDRVLKWRRQVDRGPGAREFSIRVRQAYDYRCLFSGERFPKLHVFNSAGVDGAHILPWSTHRLNAVNNGLCLCKLCHWAFDNGLLKLDFDSDSNVYLLSIPDDIARGANSAGFELLRFRSCVGPLDKNRLPRNERLWPSPSRIRELNAA